MSERRALLLSGWDFVAIDANLLSRQRSIVLPRPANVSRLPPDWIRIFWPNGLHALDVLTEFPSTRPCDRRMYGGCHWHKGWNIHVTHQVPSLASEDPFSGDNLLTPLTRSNETRCSRCSAFSRSETSIARSLVWFCGIHGLSPQTALKSFRHAILFCGLYHNIAHLSQVVASLEVPII